MAFGNSTCPNCGTSYTVGDLFCIGCGSPLPQAQAPQAAGGQGNHTVLTFGGQPTGGGVCPRCGAPTMAGNDFCMACGARLTGQAGPVGAAQGNHTVVVGAGAPAGAPAAQGGATCPVCGAPADPGNMFCIVCGAPLSGAGAPANAAPQSPAAGYGAATPLDNAAQDGPVFADGTRLKDEAPISARAQLVILTREEAAKGCRKTITIDGTAYDVDIPGGITPTTILDVPGLGYTDPVTGTPGVVKLSFFIG